MGQIGALRGIVESGVATVLANASINDVEAKLKEVDKANEELSKRWSQMLSSPQAAAYKATHDIGEWEQTQLIIDLENLLGKLAVVCIAQQNVLTTMLGALKQLAKK